MKSETCARTIKSNEGKGRYANIHVHNARTRVYIYTHTTSHNRKKEHVHSLKCKPSRPKVGRRPCAQWSALYAYIHTRLCIRVRYNNACSRAYTRTTVMWTPWCSQQGRCTPRPTWTGSPSLRVFCRSRRAHPRRSCRVPPAVPPAPRSRWRLPPAEFGECLWKRRGVCACACV